jgi:hypothetical protein
MLRIRLGDRCFRFQRLLQQPKPLEGLGQGFSALCGVVS